MIEPLSTRIATEPWTPALQEEVAVAMGWESVNDRFWWREKGCAQFYCPDYRDLNLIFAEVERMGWDWLKCLDERGHVAFIIYDDCDRELGRQIVNHDIKLCVLTALLRTKEAG